MKALTQPFLITLSLILVLAACSPSPDADQQLQQQISAAIASAADLPADNLQVSVENGSVTVSGSLACEDCGGMRTPGGVASIQQSLGAVVRAVPGVETVRFALQEPN